MQLTKKKKYISNRFSRKYRRIERLRQIVKQYDLQNNDSPGNLAILIIGRIKGYTFVEKKLAKLQRNYRATLFCSLNKKNRSDYINRFCNLYDIKDDQLHLEPISPPEYLSKYHVPVQMRIDHAYSCWYHKQKCFELMENYQNKYNIKFDCILYYRADIDEFEELRFDPLEENTIYISEEKYPHIRDTYGINDQIAYGNFEVMKKYCGIVNSIKDICDQEGILYHPELLLKKYIEREKLVVKRTTYDYMLHPSRADHLAEYDDIE